MWPFPNILFPILPVLRRSSYILCRFRTVSMRLRPAPGPQRPLDLAVAALPDALDEANGRAGEVEILAQTVFEEALVAEVQAFALVGEENECRGRTGRLRDVVNFHAMRGRRCAAVQVHVREPAIEFAGGDAA